MQERGTATLPGCFESPSMLGCAVTLCQGAGACAAFAVCTSRHLCSDQSVRTAADLHADVSVLRVPLPAFVCAVTCLTPLGVDSDRLAPDLWATF